MYDVYLDKVLLPVPPSRIQVRIRNQNRTLTLINEGEINILRQAGLTDIQFQVLIPQVQYPFAVYKGGFQGASFFTSAFETLKTDRDGNGKLKPFQFIVSRVLPNGRVLFNSNIKVSMEDYTIEEDVREGFDLRVNIRLKQYRPYGTKTVQIAAAQAEQPQVTIQEQRPAENPPQARTHTVVSGDTLWGIARRYYNDGNQWNRIFEANRSVIGSNPNRIFPNQVLTIP